MSKVMMSGCKQVSPRVVRPASGPARRGTQPWFGVSPSSVSKTHQRETTAYVAGLRQSEVVAPLVLDGPMNGEVFRAYVEQMLAPTLQPGGAAL